MNNHLTDTLFLLWFVQTAFRKGNPFQTEGDVKTVRGHSGTAASERQKKKGDTAAEDYH